MKTPKEKALDLVGEFFMNGSPASSHYTLSKDVSKCCAKVAANEIINQYKTLNVGLADGRYIHEKVNYWMNVLNEIENI